MSGNCHVSRHEALISPSSPPHPHVQMSLPRASLAVLVPAPDLESSYRLDVECPTSQVGTSSTSPLHRRSARVGPSLVTFNFALCRTCLIHLLPNHQSSYHPPNNLNLQVRYFQVCSSNDCLPSKLITHLIRPESTFRIQDGLQAAALSFEVWRDYERPQASRAGGVRLAATAG
jgi:hypothetical protein